MMLMSNWQVKSISNLVLSSVSVGALLILTRFTNPSWGIVLVILLGLSVVEWGFSELLPTLKLSIAPAVGIAIVSVMFSLFSLIHLGLKNAMIAIIFLTVISLYWAIPHFRTTLEDLKQEKEQALRWLVPLIIIVLIHWFVYTYPTDNVDNFFHATKIKYMLEGNTAYPRVVPIFDILTYPLGYHSLATFVLILWGKEVIPQVMLLLRLWSWVFFAMGVYTLSYLWFGKKIANYSLLSLVGVNIIHYYLLVYIAPNFLGFYFFMVLLALISEIEQKLSPNLHSKLESYIVFLLVSVGSIFVHPYSYQNYVLIASVYIVGKLLLGTRSILGTLKGFTKRLVLFFAVPIIIHIALDPYFWFPSLAHVHIEYPWASYMGITISNLSLFHGRGPRDTWSLFYFFLNWATIRNSNYLGLFFLVFGIEYLAYKKKSMLKALSLLFFMLFVMFLIVDRLTMNVSVPFYSTAAIERMFLWLTPVFPVFVGAGIYGFKEVISRVPARQWSRNAFYLSILLAFFLVPAVGTAHDLLSAEANFFVRSDNLQDFKWISENYQNVTVLDSCYDDSAQWMPFFEPDSNITVIFNSRIERCRFFNLSPQTFARTILDNPHPLMGYIAYIDTNAPSLNPLQFMEHYKLVRINGNNWIFDLSSTDTSSNWKVFASQLKLNGNIILGNIETFGKYFIYGFTKKYFGVRYLYLQGEDYAWLSGQEGIIGFEPCEKYNGLLIDVYSIRDAQLNITVSIKTEGVYSGSYNLTAGENLISIPVQLPPCTPVIVDIKTSFRPLFIGYVKLVS